MKYSAFFSNTALLGAGFTLALTAVATGKTFKAEDHRIKVDVITDDLSQPWGVDFLPDGTPIVTEKGGQLRLVQDGIVSTAIKGMPKVSARGQGGLLDIAVDPDFATNKTIFFTFSEPGDGGAGTALARAVLDGTSLKNMKVIYRQNIKSRTARHYGSRIAFAPDGTLFVTHGDRGDRPRSQDPFDHAGALVRINKDGSVPADNPHVDGKKALPEIWSIGHRNAQGVDMHPTTGKVWTVEHGARGGDELNQPKAGKNYGWPVISYGRHYSGLKIGEGKKKAGLEQPVMFWDPSIAPSSLIFYRGNQFPKWKNNIFIGALGAANLNRIVLNGDKVEKTETLLDGDYGRIRDVQNGPNGALYLVTDHGKLLRLTNPDK